MSKVKKRVGEEGRFLQVPYKYMQHPELTLAGAVILARIADFASMKRGYCCAANGKMAEELGLSKATISNTIGDLEQIGLIRIKGGNGERRHIYLTVEASKIEEGAPSNNSEAEIADEDPRKDSEGGYENLVGGVVNSTSPLSRPTTKKEERDEAGSFALGAQSPLREQTPSLNTTPISPAMEVLLAQDMLDAEAKAKAEQHAIVDRINRRNAEAQAKRNIPTSFHPGPAPLPETLPFDPSAVPSEQPTHVYPVPPKTTESCTAILERIKAMHRPTTVPPTANVEVATAVNVHSFITRLRTGMIKQCGSGNDSAQLEAKPKTVTGPEYRPSSIGFRMESTTDCIKASDAAHIN
jgi:DNA-binding MarR family transcriptional regulator